MIHKSITEAKAKFPELVNLVNIKSEKVVIRKHNVPVAVLIPFSQISEKSPKVNKLNVTIQELEETQSVFDKYGQGQPSKISDEEIKQLKDDYMSDKYLK